jgi:hypothetical protein
MNINEPLYAKEDEWINGNLGGQTKLFLGERSS